MSNWLQDKTQRPRDLWSIFILEKGKQQARLWGWPLQVLKNGTKKMKSKGRGQRNLQVIHIYSRQFKSIALYWKDFPKDPIKLWKGTMKRQIKFNTSKCKVRHPGKNHLSFGWAGMKGSTEGCSYSGKRFKGVLVAGSLQTSDQWPAAVKSSWDVRSNYERDKKKLQKIASAPLYIKRPRVHGQSNSTAVVVPPPSPGKTELGEKGNVNSRWMQCSVASKM